MRDGFGIDTNRIYTREDIARICGAIDYFDPKTGETREPELLRKWFRRHFLDKGLRVLVTAKTMWVDGQTLQEWVRANSVLVKDAG